MTALEATEHVVGTEQAGTRLDAFLSERVAELSRAQIQRRIEAGEVLLNGKNARVGVKLKVGDVVRFTPAPPEPVGVAAQAIPLVVLYEDAHLIVIDKAAGMVVHPAAGHASGTLVNALLHHVTDLSGIGGELRPGIVHRLDKDTSGVLVVAKTDAAHAALSKRFAEKDLLRKYRAVVSPPPAQDKGTFDTFHGRHPRDRKRFTSQLGSGRRAITHWQVLERYGTQAALLECKLDTGRTHQIRVHLAENGMPILGDPMYGRRPRDARLAKLADELGRQALHAGVLEFEHPVTGAMVACASPLPDDMDRVVSALRSLWPPGRVSDS